MKTVTATFVFLEGYVTCYVRTFDYRRGVRKQVGQTCVRHLQTPEGQPPPAALLGALAGAYGSDWQEEWTLVARRASASPGGPPGGV